MTTLSLRSTPALLVCAALSTLAAAGCGDDTTEGSGGASAAGSGGSDAGGGDAGGGDAGGGGAAPVGPSAIGDGDPARVQLVEVFAADEGRLVTDIDLHPLRDELWVLLREPYSGAPCTDDVRSGCEALQGSVAIVSGPASGAPTAEWKMDPNAWHFMRRPTGIAFGDDDTFATIHEARTGNFEDEDAEFIGPSLWSGDPEIFAIQPPGKNGSHLDMLHETPFGMGITHETANVYWAVNGNVGSVDRYDFALPHEVGGSNHADGTVHRYAEGQLLRLEEVPSHLELDAATGWLYIADTGNGRVVRLNTLSGTLGEEFTPWENMAYSVNVESAVVEEVVPAGVLAQPSGLAIAGSGDGAVLYVGDRATGTIVAFSTAGVELARLATGLEGLSGLVLAADGSLYAAAHDAGRVVHLVVSP